MTNENTANNKRIAKNTIFLYLRMVVVLLVSLYTTRVVLNVLGVVDYGIYNVVAGFVCMFAFLNSALTNATQRFYNFERASGTQESLVDIYNTSLRIQALLGLTIIILLETFGLWYIYTKMVIPPDRVWAAIWVFQCSSVSLVLLVLQTPYAAAIISHEKMDYYALVSIIDVFVKFVIVIILPYISYDQLVFYGITSLLVSLLNFILYFYYAKHNFAEIRLRKCFNKKVFRSMLSFTGWNTLDSFAYMMQGQGLNVLMNSFFGPIVNSARAVAFQVQGAINGFSENIAMAFRPQLVGSYAEQNYMRTQTLMFSMSKYCFLMVTALSIPIAIELPYILNLWLKGVVPEYTTIFTILVLANMSLNSLNMPISQTVQATGFVKYYQLIRSVIVTATLPIAWLFLHFGFSPTSVFWVTLAITVINQPVSMVILHEHFHYSYGKYIRSVIIPCCLFVMLSIILPYCVHCIMADSFIRLCVVGAVSLLSSAAIAYYVILGKAEKDVLVKYVIKIIRR